MQLLSNEMITCIDFGLNYFVEDPWWISQDDWLLNDYGVWEKKRQFDGESVLLGVEKWEQKFWGYVNEVCKILIIRK